MRGHMDRIGTFAELIAMNEADVALKPKNLTMEEAASIPLVGLTAWQVLIERANLKKGEKVLIHAGSGGVGTFAIQLAKHIGATVATTTSTANVDLVKSLGADVVIDYRQEDFEKVLSGYDVVLNSLGKDTLEKSLKVLKPGGKLISISGPPDAAFAKESGLNWFLQQVMRLLSFGIRKKAKQRGISYSFVFMRANGEQLSKITSLIESGIIRPVVDRVFPFVATQRLWLTSRGDAQKARSSSGSDRNVTANPNGHFSATLGHRPMRSLKAAQGGSRRRNGGFGSEADIGRSNVRFGPRADIVSCAPLPLRRVRFGRRLQTRRTSAATTGRKRTPSPWIARQGTREGAEEEISEDQQKLSVRGGPAY